MTTAPHRRVPHWWQRPGWSVGVVALVVLVMTVAGATLALKVSDAVPSVGADVLGEDPWADPVGIEKLGPYQIAHLPDCATGPVVRIILWDADSKPIWQVSGPPTSMTSFPVGATPAGFTADVAFRAPRAGAVVRLLVIRKLKGAAGVRYMASELRPKRVVAMLPLTRFTLAGFQSADVCGTKGNAKDPRQAVATTTPTATAPTIAGTTTSAPSATAPTTPVPTLPPVTAPAIPPPNVPPSTTAPPTTLPATTAAPTTLPATTAAPTTLPATTAAPTTRPPVTVAPTTKPPGTPAPVSPPAVPTTR